MREAIILALVAGTAVSSLLLPAGATAGPAKVDARQQISGENPFPGRRCQADEDIQLPPEQTQKARETETEPSVAVDPTDPGNIIATWQIGHSPKTSVYGAVTSHDDGETWRLVMVPGLSRCNGGEDAIAQDPGVSFAPDGRAYLASQAYHLAPPRLLVNRSSNAGDTWSEPFAVNPAGLFDKQRSPVVGDPLLSSQAYLVSSGLRGDAGLTADLYFFKSTNAGQTWSSPQPIFLAPGVNLRAFDSLLEVLPDGTLLVTFTLVHTANYLDFPVGVPERHELFAIRSLDGGQTWSPPRMIAQTGPLGPQLGAKDPDTGRVVINVPHSQFASAPDGTAYVVWHDIVSAGSSKVMLARSSDGGETWSEPRTVAARRGHTLLPSVAAMPNGTIGVTWYDTRRDKIGDGQLTTDYWFAHSHDGGETWEETRVAGPFDLNTAADRRPFPTAVAFGLGEYTGLAARPDGFATAFAMAEPQAQFGPHDVFFARLRLP